MEEKNLSRRNFITMSGLAGSSLLLGSSVLKAETLLGSPFAKSVLVSSYKVAVIGCGNRSKALINALNSVPELEMAVLCDIVPHKMEQRAQLIKTGVKPQFISDMRKVFEMSDISAVVIVTPNDTHREIAIAAMEAGKHVFCEKPLALTVVECNEIIGASERTRRYLQIGHQRRHSGEYQTLIESVRNKPVGKVLQSSLYDFRGDWRVPDADEYPKGTPYWRLSQKQSGGVVYEMGAHIIDVNNWVFDSEPTQVVSLQGVNNFSLRKRDSSDHSGVLAYYANGSLMNYGGNVYNYGSTALDTFFAVNATLQMGGGFLEIKYGSAPGFPKPKDIPQAEKISLKANNREGDGVVEQFKHFLKVLDGKAQPWPDGYTARKVVQIMEGSVRSALEKRVIDIKELG
ncbi:MAG: Gfo/Idh/MocA family oxidoreductase [Tannerella sp.]|jgi:predicted dehydrogenase|nr:Gfo/Idh/MocA family oxidoreductase [Tannerella sp.]